MSLDTLNLFKSRKIMYPDISGPVSTRNMFPIWTAFDASEHLLWVDCIDSVSKHALLIFTVCVIHVLHVFLRLVERFCFEMVELTCGLYTWLNFHIVIHVNHPAHIFAIGISDKLLVNFLCFSFSSLHIYKVPEPNSSIR